MKKTHTSPFSHSPPHYLALSFLKCSRGCRILVEISSPGWFGKTTQNTSRKQLERSGFTQNCLMDPALSIRLTKRPAWQNKKAHKCPANKCPRLARHLLRQSGEEWQQSPALRSVSQARLGTAADQGFSLVRTPLRGNGLTRDVCLGFALWESWLFRS